MMILRHENNSYFLKCSSFYYASTLRMFLYVLKYYGTYVWYDIIISLFPSSLVFHPEPVFFKSYLLSALKCNFTRVHVITRNEARTQELDWSIKKYYYDFNFKSQHARFLFLKGCMLILPVLPNHRVHP